MVRDGVLVTPSSDAALPGITRALVLELAAANGIETVVRNVSLSELYNADEVFTTGTMGELAHVTEIDGRQIGTGDLGPMTKQLRELHRAHTSQESVPIPR